MEDNGIEILNKLEIKTFLYDLDSKSIVKEDDLRIDKEYLLITDISNKSTSEIDFKSIDLKLYDESKSLENIEYPIQKGYLENKLKSGNNYLVSKIKMKQDISKFFTSDNISSKILLNRIDGNQNLITTNFKSNILLRQKDSDLFSTTNSNLLMNIENKKVNIIFSDDIDKKLIESILSLKRDSVAEKETEKEKPKETEKEKIKETEKENINNPENESNTGENSIGDYDMGEETIRPDDGEQLVSVKNKPKLIVSNYTLTPEMVKAGEEFKLNLTFYNTNYEKSVRNIKITLNGSSSTVGANGEQSSGSVFTPVNSSNTFYIGRIYSESYDTKEITLKTAPNVQAQNYSMEIKFEYEDADGNEYTASEIIGIPVVQTSKVLYGDVSVSEGVEGQPINLSMDFYNIGKDALTTFMVTVEGKDFTISGNQRYFVGNFTPGSSDSFNTEIVPSKSGTIEGNVVITYEDSTGKEHREEVPFKSEVQGEGDIVDPGFTPEEGQIIEDDNMNQTPLYQRPSLWIGVAILIIAITFFVRRRSKNKKEQEFLDLNE